jgi:hypothetical protein
MSCGNVYILTLDEEVTIDIDTPMIVTISGAKFVLIPSDDTNNDEKDKAKNTTNEYNFSQPIALSKIKLPIGTRYHINDSSIDRIGLTKKLKCANYFYLEQFTTIIIPKSSTINMIISDVETTPFKIINDTIALAH